MDRQITAFRTLVLTACVLLVAAAATAQSTLGRVVGVARDSQGAVVPGATVTLMSTDTGEVSTTETKDDGGFVFTQVPPGTYSVKLELQSFKSVTYTDVKVDPGQEYSLAARMDVGALSEEVQVTAGVDLVHTTTTEITNTVRQQQILELPLNARNPIGLIMMQAGVPGIQVRNNANTAINGGRPTWTQVTQDGINIQDNFIRVNSLDFVVTRPTTDTVGEFTIVTNTQGADAAGGASQVRMTTPSGTNELHGSAFLFNRNSALSATSWFNNRDKIAQPYLNRNQVGGRAGGPVVRNKLFFFGYYEAYRQKSDFVQNNRIPLNDDLLQGVFRYRATDGSGVRSVNVAQLSGLRIDPATQSTITSRIRGASNVNNSDVGDGLNQGGYRFNQQDINDRNYVGGKLHYMVNPSHRIEGTYTFFNEKDDRTDLDLVHDRPLVYTESHAKFFVTAWNWTVSPRLQNEVRMGFNLAPVDFKSDEDFGSTLFNMPLIGGQTNAAVAANLQLTNPIATFQPQGRNTRTFQYIDSATFITGDHTFQFGGSLQNIRVNPYNYANVLPTVSFGFSAAAPTSVQLGASQFPGGISATDLTGANNMLSFLGGVVSSVTQTFQVADATSGFVNGQPDNRNFTLNNYAVYAQDSWRVKPNVTLRAGLKWEYFTPLKEDDNLLLLPVSNGRSGRDTVLDPNMTVDFVNGGLYKSDKNNFAPSVGVAWDPFKNGKTSVRGAYTLAFVNEETITVARNAANQNGGLTSALNLTNQYAFMANGIPQIAPPALKVPRTLADQLALGVTSAAFTVDPEIKQPRVHQFNLSVEREVGWDMAVEARYVGTLGRDIWRGIDYNQVTYGDAFLQDFLRARQNGFLSQAAGLGFVPTFNPNVAGSQQLTILPQFGGGSLANSTVISNIQTGQVGSLADFYMTGAGAAVATQARAAFLANPNIYAADVVLNGGSLDYHALQIEARKRSSHGVFLQANYTFAKNLTDSQGTAQSRLETFLDNNRPQIERTRSEFDVTHVINANAVWELPFGQDRRFMNRGGVLDAIAGNWQLSTIVHWQTGQPLSFLSPRGTFNRAGRSALNMAVSDLSREELQKLFGITKMPDGKVYYIDPKVIDPATGRAVGADNLNNTAGFPGQVFFNPTAGNLGTLQRLQFDGPSIFTMDMGLSKRVRFGTRNAEVRVEAFNVFNSPIFEVADLDINSTTFGRATALEVGARVVQIGFKFNF